MTIRPRLALAALLVAGCATAPGTGFATVTGGRVAVPAVLGKARLDEAGRWKTNNGYVLALDEGKLGVELREVALQAPGAAAASGGEIKIDPANPPPGYTFCHNQDCHTADGKVKTFDEVRAELAAGGAAAAAQTVVALQPAAARLNWPPTAAAEWTLAGCEPHCFLAQGLLSQAVLKLGRVVAAGTVAPSVGGEARRWTLDLPIAGAAFPAAIAAEVGLATPREIKLSGTFTLTDKLFDGLPWDRLRERSGPIALEADQAAAEVLATNLAKSTWSATLTTTP